MSLLYTYDVLHDSDRLFSSRAVERGTAGSLDLSDADHFAVLYPSWEVRFIQVDAGRLNADAAYTRLPGLVDRRVRTDRKIQARGFPLASTYVLTPITEANQRWRFRGGQKLRPGDIKIDSPGEELDEMYDAGSERRSLEVDGAMLREALAVASGKDLDELLPRGFALRPAARAFQAFVARLEQTARFQSAGKPEFIDPTIAAQLLDDYLDAVCCLMLGDTQEGSPIGPRGGRLEFRARAG